MAAKMSVLFSGILLFFCTHSATAKVPTPTIWPIRFHALLVQNFSGELAVMNLWYDWGKGGNLHLIQDQLGTLHYDMEWTNGTSFIWEAEDKTCVNVTVGVGILRPDWLADADFVGVEEKSGFTCNVFNKLNFIIYYEDVETGKPVYWKFYTEREVHVITFEKGVPLNDEMGQAPEYCFSDKQNENSDNRLLPRKSPASKHHKEWLMSGAISAQKGSLEQFFVH